MKKIELLAPAGDLEKLKIAILYGADAVYFAGENFGLRAAARNFTLEDIREGVTFAHNHHKKVYMTANIFAHNQDIEQLTEYLESIKDIPIDAFIVSDAGILTVIKSVIPEATIHLSTQANTTNYKTAEFWFRQGVKRIVLARELSLDEIKELRGKIPQEEELEAFVHGAMCISYSGRCLLSNFMSQRDANRGACTHPCRWEYVLVEKQRPGELFTVEEDQRGTYIMNSKDLCMIGFIPELIQSGLNSLKIEGRMKSIYYVATIVGTYRKAIDAYYDDPNTFVFDESWLEELTKVSHREFTTGFYLNKPDEMAQNYSNNAYKQEYDFLGLVKQYNSESGFATVEQRNKICIGDKIEVFGPNVSFYDQKIEVMIDEDGNPIESAPHAQQIIHIKMDRVIGENFMLRRKSKTKA